MLWHKGTKPCTLPDLVFCLTTPTLHPWCPTVRDAVKIKNLNAAMLKFQESLDMALCIPLFRTKNLHCFIFFRECYSGRGTFPWHTKDLPITTIDWTKQ